MLCFKCRKETPDSNIYCHHCGTKLDMTFEQVTKKFKKDILEEYKTETEDFLKSILFTVLLLLIFGWLFQKTWENPPAPISTPGFIPSVKIPPTWAKVEKP